MLLVLEPLIHQLPFLGLKCIPYYYVAMETSNKL